MRMRSLRHTNYHESRYVTRRHPTRCGGARSGYIYYYVRTYDVLGANLQRIMASSPLRENSQQTKPLMISATTDKFVMLKIILFCVMNTTNRKQMFGCTKAYSRQDSLKNHVRKDHQLENAIY